MAEPLNLKSFGAIADRKTDNVGKINYALEVASAQGQGLHFGPGSWAYSDILSATGVEITCDSGAALYALNPARSALFLHGVGSSVRGLVFDGVKPPGRLTTRESCRIVAMGARKFSVSDVLVKTCAGAGIRSDGSADGTISGNWVLGSLADAIHITDGSNTIEITSNTIDRSGDDGVAVVSYRTQANVCKNITASRNKITNNVGGRCMSVVGGQDIFYSQNEMIGNANAAGLYLACESNKDFQSMALLRVRAERNTIRNCGNRPPAKGDHPAVLLYSDDLPNDSIIIARHHIVQDMPNVGGIRVYGKCTNVAVDANSIIATPPLRIDTSGVTVTPYTAGAVGIA